MDSRTAPSLTVTVPAPLLRARDSEKVDEAVRRARTGALAAGRGIGRAGAFIGRQGVGLAQKGAQRAQRVPVPQVQAVANRVLPPEPAPTPSHRGRNILIALGIGAIAAGGVVFYTSRRREHPPVAPAPPTLHETEENAPSAGNSTSPN